MRRLTCAFGLYLTVATLCIAQAQAVKDDATEQEQTTVPPAPPARSAAEQLQQQKRQRILGIIPNFNTSFVQNAAPLTSRQKFGLAFRSSIDPFTFVAAGLNAGFGQVAEQFPGYGYGAQGYAKRFGAAWADNFDGTMIGGAVFPSLLHQDPRYFRKGTGTVRSRFFYAISTTVRTKSDKGKWQPNYSNVLGNIAAGGIANLYYPAEDRGASLTFQRAFIVTAQGAIGSLFVEFWPDISSKLFRKH